MDSAPTTRSAPFVSFAGVLALIIGGFNVISGIAAIAEDDQTERVNEVLFGVNITAWGWVWLILGAVQILTGYLILVRNRYGLYFGLFWAALNAMLTVFLIFVEPFWAILVIAVDIVIIKSLLDNADEFA